jgi:ABC-2 type transport system ATP-binding protein
MPVSLKITALFKKMGPNQALNGVSADLEGGRLHGLIGPDAAGKTTLIRTLIGLLKPDSGLTAYFEDGVSLPFEHIRPRMAYFPQQQSLYPDLSITEHLELFRELYQVSPEAYAQRSERLLEITRLKPFADRAAGKLSGGMYKKLGLMCALLASPAIVLLDEPTNGVDPISRRELWDLLYQLRDQGVTVIVSTSYMDEAERCDRVLLLDKGRTLAQGEPRAVLQAQQAASFEQIFLKHEPEEAR